MGDPLSVTASVVGIVAAAVQGLQLLSNTINRIKNAPEAVRSIQDDIQQLNPILTQLDSAITEGRSAIVRYEAEILASSGVEDKEGLPLELGQQRATIDAFQGICESALKTVVFERTWQAIRDVKATDNSVALTGFVNAEGEEARIEQDTSQIAADGRSISVAGVVNNVDFTALSLQMHQSK